MNGLILESAPHGKDIKFIDKKGKDIEANDDSGLFEKLVTSLIEGEEKSDGSSFLLAKLLNIPTKIDKVGKKISEFSKDDILNALNDTLSNSDDKNSDNEVVVLEELFKVALSLKNNQELNLDSLDSKPLKDALNSKNIIPDLKNAKNIKELLDIANRHGLKVKNFEFFKEERALDQADKKLVQKVTSQEIFKMIEPKTKHITKHNKSDKNILTTLINREKIVKKSDIKISTIQKNETKETKIDTTQTKDIKVELKQTQTQKVDASKINTNTTIKDTTKKELDSPKIKETKSDKPQNIEQEDTSDLTQKQEPKTDNSTKHKHQTKQTKTDTLTNLLKDNKLQTNDAKKDEEKEIKIDDNKDIKEPSVEKSSSDLKSQTHLKTKDPQQIKKSLNTFAAEFKEKVESYKAPLMKVKMQLSPQSLGDVDVTLINRGNTLHVNITSNTNSMALFMQNQAEFRNSLVNMGFSDLQMNFSDNKNGQNQQNQQKDDDSNSKYSESLNEEESDSVDIILPNYV